MKRFLWCPGKDFSMRVFFPGCRVGVSLPHLTAKALANQPSEIIAVINPLDELQIMIFCATHQLLVDRKININLSLAFMSRDREFFKEAPYNKYEIQPLE